MTLVFFISVGSTNKISKITFPRVLIQTGKSAIASRHDLAKKISFVKL